MAFDFEALVGHLYVVNGRAISTPPPGALVEVAPKKAARGREIDTFLVLTLPMGDTVAPPVFYENMSALAAEKYFASTGSVTAGIRYVFGFMNENLYDHNIEARRSGKRHYEASMIAAVLRGSELYIARVGSAVAALRMGITTDPFPTQFDDDDGLFGVPLGVQHEPDIKLARYDLKPGARLILSDVALADFSRGQVDGALMQADIGAMLNQFKEMSSGRRHTTTNLPMQLSLMGVEFVPSEAPVPLPVRDVESTAVLTSPSAALTTSTTEAAAADSANTSTNGKVNRNPLRRSAARTEALDRTVGGMALTLSRVLQVLNRILDILVPRPKPGERGWLATPAATFVAVLIPIAVVVLVIVLWVTGTGESEYDRCINEAEETAGIARDISTTDVQGTINGWNAVIIKARECQQLRPNDPQMEALVTEARTVVDLLLAIERREMIVLDTFPNALLSRVVLQGEDLYVLDDGNDQVYRVTLNSDGLSIARRQEAIPAMRRNASVAQFTIGDVVDIAWAEEGDGLSQSNAITMLDANGVLVDCSPRFLQDCSAQQLPAIETWNSPNRIVFWGGGLYVLDAPANQIWRYRSPGAAFSNTPTEYFTGSGRPDIRGAVDFDIDNEGLVYVLMGDGRLMRFNSGVSEDFAFTFRPGQSMNESNSMFLSNNPIAQSLFFVDRLDRTIFETTFSGTFMRAYRSFDEDLFAAIADVAVDVNRGIVYTVSGNSLFAFRRN